MLIGSEFLPVIVKQIETAAESIWVVMFEWSWYPGQRTGTVQDLNRAIAIRGRDGLEVKVLLHNESIGRHLHKINRKTASHLTQNKVQVKWGNTGIPLHAKVWIFDQARVVIGSHNISARAVRTNVECSVLFQDDAECVKVVQWFEGLWGKGM